MRKLMKYTGLAILYVCIFSLAVGVCAVEVVPEENQVVYLLCLFGMLVGAITGGLIAWEAE